MGHANISLITVRLRSGANSIKLFTLQGGSKKSFNMKKVNECSVQNDHRNSELKISLFFNVVPSVASG